MTRDKAKKLLSVITHFANGGNLWYYYNEWNKQKELFDWNSGFKAFNVIEDKNFEARKAFSLGEDIEARRRSSHYPWESVGKALCDFNDSFEYRPKPKKSSL